MDGGNVADVMSKTKLAAYFETGAQNLLRAGALAGVHRHVVLSIIGIDRVPLPYDAAKLQQEKLALAGPVPTTIVRATQFHNFPGQVMQQSRKGPIAFIPSMRVQPVATSVVAQVLLDVVEDPAAPLRTQIAGPDQISLVTAARKTANTWDRPPKVVPFPLPGAAGRAIRAGALTLPGGALSGPSFADWLSRGAS